MKTKTTAIIVTGIMLFTACVKENATIQSSSITDESSVQADISTASVGSVTIGTQVWMKKNLSVSRYRNGDRIPQVTDPSAWATLTTGSWCWYNNDSATGAVYGKLYNWYAVNDPRGLAPEGWHVPSDSEWTTLSTYLGGETVAGGRMKSKGTIEAGTGLWYAPNYASNISGFTGFPGGLRVNNDGAFINIGISGYWWSSTPQDNINYPIARNLIFNNRNIERSGWGNNNGFSVRCIKN